ncbi:RNA polymerase sigma factor [Asticcacaulis sp. ZE23SCel15]|uniref:RNA polymerase sigma factor n=1 Tax=Asticcacaulis sp. ZE23SCel15 TaxID=3059027 RepID=UPI00265F86DF|nr:RNA polymerase sigma factor [Asticcacaulis sp. ZE23SCel15]WKL56348.1 RNA polymerase sigma factor [Asticcacaulis sp. ZE23SCel15]
MLHSAGENSAQDQSDIDLIGRAVTGSHTAFGELVRRHSGALRTHLRRMGAQSSDADDIAQETFMAAFERLSEFRFEGPFIAWLKMIASRRYLKKLKVAQKYLFTDDVTLFETPDQAPPPADMRLHDLDSALSQLKPIERVCVTLNFSAGLSHGDVAVETGLPLGTVKSHIKRGLDQLKFALMVPNASSHPNSSSQDGATVSATPTFMDERR